MANDPAHRGPPKPAKLTGSSPSERERMINEGSEPSLPGGGTYFLGRYRIVDEIGVGGMASVHLARADGPGGFQKWVAIKRIHRHLAEDETFIRMFLDEARIAARISHPNVAQVFDLGKHRDTYWIAMEYLHGEPLREVMRAIEEAGAPPMGPLLAAKMISDSAEGLHAAHELRDKGGNLLNLVHRDVTPHNLFLTYDGAVKVVDFGIAKVTGRLSNTRAGTLKGKLAYMSPEQVRGASVDRRTDIFALGVVLWELTTGRRLFRMESDLETLERVQACVVPPPSTVIENYPVELEAIVMRALAKDLNKRYASAREMSRALQQYLMRVGAFIGPEEIGAYVKQVLSDRFEKREAHLQWAAEVTQTISLDQLQEGGRELEDVSILTYASDVQERPTSGGPPRPAAGAPPPTRAPRGAPSRAPSATPPPMSRSRPLPPSRPPPRPAAGQPSQRDPRGQPLPSYDLNTASTAATQNIQRAASSVPKRTMLGLGAPAAPEPEELPSYELNTAASSPGAAAAPPPGMHTYDEDEDAVTRVMPGLGEEDEPQTISTVHEPARSVQPAPQPSAPVVVSESDYQHSAPRPAAGGYGTPPPPQASAGPYGPPPQPQQPSYSPQPEPQPAGAAPKGDSRTILIALIAATTTLIALALTALVILKVTESKPSADADKPSDQVAATAPAPAPTPEPVAKNEPKDEPKDEPKAEETVDPSSLPTEEKEEAPAPKPAPRPRAVAGVAPRRAPAPKPKADPGFLTVVCDPFCDAVIAGGRNLGPSPVVRSPLPPGNHGVLLRRSGSGSKSIGVTIVSGQTTARRVKME